MAESCDGRVVKALDLKSNGIFPRRFEPYSQRNFLHVKHRTTVQVVFFKHLTQKYIHFFSGYLSARKIRAKFHSLVSHVLEKSNYNGVRLLNTSNDIILIIKDTFRIHISPAFIWKGNFCRNWVCKLSTVVTANVILENFAFQIHGRGQWATG